MDSEFEQLIDAHIDGRLSEAETARLAEILTTDSAAAARFAEASRMEHMLREAVREDHRAAMHARRLTKLTPKETEAKRSRLTPGLGRALRPMAIAAAIALLLGGLMAWVTWSRPDALPQAQADKEERAGERVIGSKGRTLRIVSNTEGELKRRLREFRVPLPAVQNAPASFAFATLNSAWAELPHSDDAWAKTVSFTLPPAITEAWQRAGKEPSVSLDIPNVSILTNLELFAAQTGLQTVVAENSVTFEPETDAAGPQRAETSGSIAEANMARFVAAADAFRVFQSEHSTGDVKWSLVGRDRKEPITGNAIDALIRGNSFTGLAWLPAAPAEDVYDIPLAGGGWIHSNTPIQSEPAPSPIAAGYPDLNRIEELKTELENWKSQQSTLRNASPRDLIRHCASLDLQDPVIEKFYPDFQQASLELEDLLTMGLGPKHPAVVGLQQRLATAERLLTEAAKKCVQTLDAKTRELEQSLGAHLEARTRFNARSAMALTSVLEHHGVSTPEVEVADGRLKWKIAGTKTEQRRARAVVEALEESARERMTTDVTIADGEGGSSGELSQVLSRQQFAEEQNKMNQGSGWQITRVALEAPAYAAMIIGIPDAGVDDALADSEADGDKLAADQDYEAAFKKYENGLALLPEDALTASHRVRMTGKYARAGVQYAKKLAEHGSYGQCRAVLEVILSEKVDPEYAPAKQILKDLDEEDTYNGENNLDIRQKAEASTLYWKGLGYFNLGLFKEAEDTFNQMLIKDPDNTAARRQLERVEHEIALYYKASRDHTRQRMLNTTDVEELWMKADAGRGPASPGQIRLKIWRRGDRIEGECYTPRTGPGNPPADADIAALEKKVNGAREEMLFLMKKYMIFHMTTVDVRGKVVSRYDPEHAKIYDPPKQKQEMEMESEKWKNQLELLQKESGKNLIYAYFVARSGDPAIGTPTYLEMLKASGDLKKLLASGAASEHPQVQSLQRKVNEMEAAIEKAAEDYKETLKINIANLNEQLKAIDAGVAVEAGDLKNQDELSPYQQAKRQYEILLGSLNDARVRSLLRAGQSSQLSNEMTKLSLKPGDTFRIEIPADGSLPADRQKTRVVYITPSAGN